MEFSLITVQTVNLTKIVTLNRPDKLNALNNTLLTELDSLLDNIENDNNVKCLVITGSGEKAFAAGADISELKNMDKAKAEQFSKFGQEIFNRISSFKKPIIAAINGFALGGGFELALACHLRFASENAKFGLPEINLGVIPGYGGTQRLTELINKNRAAELILTGSFIDAEEAFRLGIVNKVYPFSKLMDKSLEFAELVSSKSQIAISAALNSIFSFNKNSFNTGLKIESNQFFNAVNSNDFDEGTAAFLEKRKPNFKDY